MLDSGIMNTEKMNKNYTFNHLNILHIYENSIFILGIGITKVNLEIVKADYRFVYFLCDNVTSFGFN